MVAPRVFGHFEAAILAPGASLALLAGGATDRATFSAIAQGKQAGYNAAFPGTSVGGIFQPIFFARSSFAVNAAQGRCAAIGVVRQATASDGKRWSKRLFWQQA